jgi:hypothetical protein
MLETYILSFFLGEAGGKKWMNTETFFTKDVSEAIKWAKKEKSRIEERYEDLNPHCFTLDREMYPQVYQYSESKIKGIELDIFHLFLGD